jgi:hypothetical protein
MSLDQFIEANHVELLSLTRGKAAKRNGPAGFPAIETEHGVPLFLSQLREALVEEAKQDPGQGAQPDPPTNPDIAVSAGLHGRDLLGLGFSVDQVVHDYGDVCQAVTELAVERDAPISVPEFHTLNRCLDNAIAAAVSSWSKEREREFWGAAEGHRPRSFDERLRTLLSGAIVVFDLLRTGKIAAGGSAGMVLHRNLAEMLAMLDVE